MTKVVQRRGASCGRFPSPECLCWFEKCIYGSLAEIWSVRWQPSFSETRDHVLAKKYETFWGRRTSTGCPQPKNYMLFTLTKNIESIRKIHAQGVAWESNRWMNKSILAIIFWLKTVVHSGSNLWCSTMCMDPPDWFNGFFSQSDVPQQYTHIKVE